MLNVILLWTCFLTTHFVNDCRSICETFWLCLPCWSEGLKLKNVCPLKAWTLTYININILYKYKHLIYILIYKYKNCYHCIVLLRCFTTYIFFCFLKDDRDFVLQERIQDNREIRQSGSEGKVTYYSMQKILKCLL